VIRHGRNITEAPVLHRGKQRAEPPNLQNKKETLKYEWHAAVMAYVICNAASVTRINVLLISMESRSQSTFIT